jgi:hypothetical protein
MLLRIFDITSARDASWTEGGDGEPWGEESSRWGHTSYPCLETARRWQGPNVICLELLNN